MALVVSSPLCGFGVELYPVINIHFSGTSTALLSLLQLNEPEVLLLLLLAGVLHIAGLLITTVGELTFRKSLIFTFGVARIIIKRLLSSPRYSRWQTTYEPLLTSWQVPGGVEDTREPLNGKKNRRGNRIL